MKSSNINKGVIKVPNNKELKCMYDILEEKQSEEEKQWIEQIEKAKKYYDEHTYELEKQQRINNLLLKDYILSITATSHYSYYDYFGEYIEKAMIELKNDKPKKEIFKVVQDRIGLDFFNDKNIKIETIGYCGTDDYSYFFKIKYHDKDFQLQLPIKKNITVQNLKWARYGKFALFQRTSSVSVSLLIDSYSVKEIRKYMKDFFKKKGDKNEEID